MKKKTLFLFPYYVAAFVLKYRLAREEGSLYDLDKPPPLPDNAPPAFLLAANDDCCCATPPSTSCKGYHATKVPVEAYIYT